MNGNMFYFALFYKRTNIFTMVYFVICQQNVNNYKVKCNAAARVYFVSFSCLRRVAKPIDMQHCTYQSIVTKCILDDIVSEIQEFSCLCHVLSSFIWIEHFVRDGEFWLMF